MGSFHKALKKGELPPGKARCVEVAGVRIALFNIGGGFVAIDDGCTHAEASLADGALVDDCTVECPWHGAQFDLKTGKAKSLPAVEGVRVYATRVSGDDVEIEVE